MSHKRITLHNALVPVACLGLALIHPASATGSFDGSYRGTQRTLRSNNSAACASLDHDNIRIVVQDNHFNRRWGQADLAVDIPASGAFHQSVVTTDSRKMRTIEITGTIKDGTMDAEIGTSLCAAHLSLRKS
jgi:hypothetical protein